MFVDIVVVLFDTLFNFNLWFLIFQGMLSYRSGICFQTPHAEISANLLLFSSERVVPNPNHACNGSDDSSKCLGFACFLQRRLDEARELTAAHSLILAVLASSKIHWTRGFNTELRCSSPEGITGAWLREMDPRHIYSQGCPSSTLLQCTNT